VDSDIVEFVVLGRFGAYLRSVLSDLEIEDRPAQSVLVFREPDQLALLQLLATVIGEGREVESVRCLSGGRRPRRSAVCTHQSGTDSTGNMTKPSLRI